MRGSGIAPATTAPPSTETPSLDGGASAGKARSPARLSVRSSPSQSTNPSFPCPGNPTLHHFSARNFQLEPDDQRIALLQTLHHIAIPAEPPNARQGYQILTIVFAASPCRGGSFKPSRRSAPSARQIPTAASRIAPIEAAIFVNGEVNFTGLIVRPRFLARSSISISPQNIHRAPELPAICAWSASLSICEISHRDSQTRARTPARSYTPARRQSS